MNKNNTHIILTLLLLVFVGQSTTVSAASCKMMKQSQMMTLSLESFTEPHMQMGNDCMQKEACTMSGCISFTLTSLVNKPTIQIASNDVAVLPVSIALKITLSSLYRPPILS